MQRGVTVSSALRTGIVVSSADAVKVGPKPRAVSRAKLTESGAVGSGEYGFGRADRRRNNSQGLARPKGNYGAIDCICVDCLDCSAVLVWVNKSIIASR